jgi:DNA-binding NtrC family response regulator
MGGALRTVLVVDDEVGIRESLRMILKQDYEVALAKNAEEAFELFKHHSPDVILLDILLPDLDGLKVLEQLKKRDPDGIVIMITSTRTLKTTIEAMKLGADDYITKPFDIDELRLAIHRCLSSLSLKKEIEYHRDEQQRQFHADEMIGQSRAVTEMKGVIRQVAESRSTVLILGESGTGKELVARAVHFQSPRRNGPFITINCAAIPETLIESELFGVEKGAFTNAFEKRLGRFEVAHQGSVFLDEIGELSLNTQAKILRVLDEKEFNRVGGTKTIKVDVRLIAATNQDLPYLIRDGRFREDLYFRIHVVPIQLPPLRQRKEDIPLLVDHFIRKYGLENRKRIQGVSPEALIHLMRYDWPGNVRELENLIERAVALATREVIEPADLPFPPDPPSRTATLKGAVLSGRLSLTEAEADFEREVIQDALTQTRYVQSHAAEMLGVSRRILKYKMDKLGIPPEKDKEAPEA